MNYRVLSLSILLFACTAAAAAQDINGFPTAMGHRGIRAGGISANCSLNGSVRAPDNQPVRDARVEVRALDTGSTLISAYSLPNGSFEFANVPRGTYEVVAILGVREARERVEIDHTGVSVELRLHGEEATSGGAASVSVSQLKVPDKAKTLFAKAEEAFKKGKFDHARDNLAKALQVFPNYAQALTLRGLLLLLDNKLEQASTDLEQAIKNDYNYALAYSVLGATYNLMKRYDDSVRVLERSIALTPASWQSYLELSKALLGKGQFEAALRQVNKASALAPPSYTPIHLVKAHALLGVKNYDQAVAELELYLGSNPSGVDSARAREALDQVRALRATSGK
jgi:tetratricopeptide (TPR) repeat protein